MRNKGIGIVKVMIGEGGKVINGNGRGVNGMVGEIGGKLRNV